MTRETQVGLVVVTTFLCLVGLVVASKLRPPEAASVESLTEEFSEPLPDTNPPPPPPPVAQAPPAPPAPPATSPAAAPSTPPAAVAEPPPLTSSAGANDLGTSSLPAVTLPKVEGNIGSGPKTLVPPSITQPPAQASGPEGTTQTAAGQTGSSSPEVVASAAGQSKLPVGLPQQQPQQLPQQEPPKKSGDVTKPALTLPEVSAPPVSDPLVAALPMPMGAQAKQEMPPAVPAPLEKKDLPPVKTEVSVPMPPASAPGKGPFSEPLANPATANPPMPAPGDPGKGKNEGMVAVPPLVAPAPISPALTGTTTGDTKTAQAVQQQPSPQTKASSNLPPITSIPPAKTESIGTIGPAGGDVPTTPAIAPGKPAQVPSIPTSGSKPAPVKKFSDERHVCDTPTTFDKLSEKLYGSPKYGRALLEYNRQHLLTAQASNLSQESPLLQPGQAVYYPHLNILEMEYGRHIQAPAVPTGAASQALVKISPPTPLTNPPTSDPTVSYRLPQNEHICAIAARTLGDYKKWDEILRLNPWLDRMDVNQIPANTVLRLPASARVN